MTKGHPRKHKLTNEERDILLELREVGESDLATLVVTIIVRHSPPGTMMSVAEAGRHIVDLARRGCCSVRRGQPFPSTSGNVEPDTDDLLLFLNNSLETCGDTVENVRVTNLEPSLWVAITDSGLQAIGQ